MNVQKIYVNKEDEAAFVVERVVKAETEDVVLCIPKFSTFGKSVHNFRLLKSEGEALGKTIRIESVDDSVVLLAKQCNLGATNPFFQKSSGAFSDIVVRRQTAQPQKCAELPKEEPLVIKTYSETQHADQEPKQFSIKKIILAITVMAFGGALSFVAFRVLPKADIALVTQKKKFAYANVLVVDKSVRTIDAGAMKIPGQLFIEKKNASLTFPATGKKFIEKKAEGKLVVTNAYSSEPQTLVQKTRFTTDKGIIVRLKKSIVVPGAKIVDGKIVPSTIETEVIADKSGAEYNIPVGMRLAIPGLKGTPRYDGFYGETKNALAGGFVGERAYPTDDDMKKAKIAIAGMIADNAKATALQKVPVEFKTLEDGMQFRMIKETVNPDVNDGGMSSIFGEGELSMMAFRESDVAAALADRAAKEIGREYEKKSEELKYGLPKLDLAIGKMTVPIDYASVLAPIIKTIELKERIINKSERELKALLLATPGLESATVSLWPFWVRRVPENQEKIAVDIK